jgi:hypothetical protein
LAGETALAVVVSIVAGARVADLPLPLPIASRKQAKDDKIGGENRDRANAHDVAAELPRKSAKTLALF